MNAITQTLLASAALGALATAPAMAAAAPHFNISAVHAGKLVNKTRIHDPSRQHLTYTYGIYASIPYKLDKKIDLGSVFKWNSYSTVCSQPRQKFIYPKKTQYAKIGKYTATYSLGCQSGPTVYTGLTYKLTNPDGKGQTDYFVSTLIGWFQNSRGKYKGTMNLDVTVEIGS